MRRMLLVAVLVATAAAAPASSEPQRVAGTLALELTMGITYVAAVCPSDVPQDDGTGCTEQTGQGTARGLGRVTTVYIVPYRNGAPTCPANLAKKLPTTARLVVAGKGEITLALAAGANCVAGELLRNEPQMFTVTGGTGAFGGASGGGRVERVSPIPGSGTETWTGTLVAPSHEFDLAPPKIAGASAKTVRAPKGARSAKVAYRVTAVDSVDGAVPVACQPKSGSRFKVGKTTVRCEARDSSANTAKAAFVITVRKRP